MNGELTHIVKITRYYYARDCKTFQEAEDYALEVNKVCYEEIHVQKCDEEGNWPVNHGRWRKVD